MPGKTGYESNGDGAEDAPTSTTRVEGAARADAPSEQAGERGGEAAESCMPCRGSGSVISTLGGSESTVQCPWCEGTGHRVAGIDAQARRRAAQASQDVATD